MRKKSQKCIHKSVVERNRILRWQRDIMLDTFSVLRRKRTSFVSQRTSGSPSRCIVHVKLEVSRWAVNVDHLILGNDFLVQSHFQKGLACVILEYFEFMTINGINAINEKIRKIASWFLDNLEVQCLHSFKMKLKSLKFILVSIYLFSFSI